MAWIELHPEVWTHPKTYALAAALKVEPMLAAAHIIRLWTWAIEAATDGKLGHLPAEEIAAGAGWRRKAGAFVGALVAAGWIDGGTMELHDWVEYTVMLRDKREDAKTKTAQRVQRYRDRKKQECNALQNVTCNADVTPLQTYTGNAPPYLTVPTTEEEEYSAPAREGTEVRCFEEYSTLIQPSSRLSDETLQSFLDDGAEDEMICAVIEEAHANDGRTLSYVRTALQRSMDRGVLTAAQYAESQRRWAERGQDGGRNRGHGPPTHNGGLPPNSPNLLL